MLLNQWLSPAFCQGFRCGHIEGRGSESSDVVIHANSLEAAEAQAGLGYYARQEWASGYRYGFKSGQAGKGIPRAIIEAPLPCTEGNGED